jgi:glucose-1-phosphate adenylyltransferase
VATQYKAHSLIRHLQRGWNFLQPVRNESFDILPASQRVAVDQWYAGTADAGLPEHRHHRRLRAEFLIVLAGDHIYKMDYERMLVQHVNSGADVTVACIEVPSTEATGFGVMHVDAADRIVAFVEKPAEPPELADRPGFSLASMGVYVFRRVVLNEALRRDAADPDSNHDFGRDIIPYMVQNANAVAHRFGKSCVKSRDESKAYWRDVGTLDAYFEANIDLTDVVPVLDLYDRNWPIWSYAEITPPAKFVHDADGRRGVGVTSLVAGGCIVSGSSLRRSLLFTGVHLHSYGSVENAVILPNVDIGKAGAPQERRRRRQREDPRRARRRRGLGRRRRPLPPHRQGHLPRHAVDDRSPRAVTRVLSVASEVYPLVKTGGLGDVVAALPPALAREGVIVRTLVPGYPAVMDALHDAETAHTVCKPARRARPARLLRGGRAQSTRPRRAETFRAGGQSVCWSRRQAVARQRDPVCGAVHRCGGRGARRARELRAGRRAGARLAGGLNPALLHYTGAPRPATVMTVHNLAFQGQFP